MNLLIRRNNETCLWLSSGDMVSCSYGTVGGAAMKLYCSVPADVARTQIQAHLDKGWEIVKGGLRWEADVLDNDTDEVIITEEFVLPMDCTEAEAVAKAVSVLDMRDLEFGIERSGESIELVVDDRYSVWLTPCFCA